MGSGGSPIAWCMVSPALGERQINALLKRTSELSVSYLSARSVSAASETVAGVATKAARNHRTATSSVAARQVRSEQQLQRRVVDYGSSAAAAAAIGIRSSRCFR